jgi:hypothetical protein
VEAARVFAQSILREGGVSVERRIDFAFLTAVSRSPDPLEREVLTRLLHQNQSEYATSPLAARALVATGLAPLAMELDMTELAAWTGVARAILNLDEAVSRN